MAAVHNLPSGAVVVEADAMKVAVALAKYMNSLTLQCSTFTVEGCTVVFECDEDKQQSIVKLMSEKNRQSYYCGCGLYYKGRKVHFTVNPLPMRFL